MSLAENFISILRDELNLANRGLHEPWFYGNEWNYVKECLDSGWVSSVGSYVNRFEEQLAQITGTKYVIACVNGTAALHVCFLLTNVKDDDEVLLPALCFIATANAVSYCRAIPHFVDVEPHSLGVDAQKLAAYLQENTEVRNRECFNKKTGRRIPVLVLMHSFGHPSDIDAIKNVLDKFHIKLIEDAAESLGSYYKNKMTGSFGDVAALSFNGNKIVTTGGGGAVLTNDEKLAKQARHLTTTARVPHAWEYVHDTIGYNYRLPNLNAALGCAQLENLKNFLEYKRKLANRYATVLKNFKGGKVFQEAAYAKSNYWLNLFILDPEFAHERDTILNLAHQNKIFLRPAWELLHQQPMFKTAPRMDLLQAEDLRARIISLPSSAILAKEFS